MKTKLLVFLLLTSIGLSVKAESISSEEQKQLIEQEFQSIDLEKDFEKEDEDSDGKFKFIEQNNSEVKQISIRNEFYESLKILLTSDNEKLKLNNIEIYLNAYETKNAVNISKNAQYRVEVYNLYNQYLGHIYKANTKKKNIISISPFLLIADKKEAIKKKLEFTTEPVKEKSEEQEVSDKNEIINEINDEKTEFKAITESAKFIEEIITEKETEETQIFREAENKKNEIETKEISIKSEPLVKAIVDEEDENTPQPKEIKLADKENNNTLVKPISPVDSKARSIKIANISDSSIHIDMIDPEGKPIGGGWTIDNDIYVPQYLNLESEPITIDPNVKLLINNSKSDQIVTKYAKELNIDEKGNYVWFID